MTRRIMIAGNWKMNTRTESAQVLAGGLASALGSESAVEVAVCPPAPYLGTAAAAIQGSAVGLGAQNLYAADDGAYTGEMNAGMLTDVGCQYVILGHSERRAILGETDAQVSEKLHSALAGQLVPIVCVGETLGQRESGDTEKVVEEQIRGSLAGLPPRRHRLS